MIYCFNKSITVNLSKSAIALYFALHSIFFKLLGNFIMCLLYVYGNLIYSTEFGKLFNSYLYLLLLSKEIFLILFGKLSNKELNHGPKIISSNYLVNSQLYSDYLNLFLNGLYYPN